MGRKKYEPTVLERARDELFSHIQRCGVLQAEQEQRREWLTDTIDYLAERYPDLSASDLDELRTMGERYCSPAIPHGSTDARDMEDVRMGVGEPARPDGSEVEAAAVPRASDTEPSEVGAA